MDEIERRIRAARPLSGHRLLPLTERAKRELADLLLGSGEGPTHQPRAAHRRWTRVGPRLLAAVLIVGAVMVAFMWQPHSRHAIAATPPVLDPTPVADPGDQLARLAEEARASGGAASSETITIHMMSWSLNTDMDAAGQVSSAISPEVYTITIGADGSRRQVVTAGHAVDAHGNPAESDPAPGTVLSELYSAPGEYEPLFTSPAPTTASEIGPFLEAGSGLDAQEHASSAFLAITYLLVEQQLDGQQTAAIIDFLAGLPDIEVAGTVTDRLGRPALALAGPRPTGDYTDYLLLAAESGSIIGFETVYTGHDRPDINSPAVTSYQIWTRS